MNLFSVVLLNIVINGLFSFLTAYLLVEFFLFLFWIKRPRIKAWARTLVVFKVVVDFCLYDWANWTVMHGIDPWQYPAGTRQLTLACGYEGLFPFMKMGFSLFYAYTFSLADLVVMQMSKGMVIGVAVALGFITVCSIIRTFFCLIREIWRLRALTAEGHLSQREITNSVLQKTLKHLNLKIFLHPKLKGSPFLAGFYRPQIFFPESLMTNLEQSEYEAILAHELAHAKQKDPLLRTALFILSGLFWWIPTQHLIRTVEEQQELAADQRSLAYGISSQAVASAMTKVYRLDSSEKHRLRAAFLNTRLKRRVQALFAGNKRVTLLKQGTCCMGFLCILTVFFGKFWVL